MYALITYTVYTERGSKYVVSAGTEQFIDQEGSGGVVRNPELLLLVCFGLDKQKLSSSKKTQRRTFFKTRMSFYIVCNSDLVNFDAL